MGIHWACTKTPRNAHTRIMVWRVATRRALLNDNELVAGITMSMTVTEESAAADQIHAATKKVGERLFLRQRHLAKAC